jgi:hypothetical protein
MRWRSVSGDSSGVRKTERTAANVLWPGVRYVNHPRWEVSESKIYVCRGWLSVFAGSGYVERICLNLGRAYKCYLTSKPVRCSTAWFRYRQEMGVGFYSGVIVGSTENML